MKHSPLLALLLILPAPSVGVLFGMILMPGTSIGQGIFILSKIWILLLPAGWFFWVERARYSHRKTAPGGYRMGWITGLGISAFIIMMYLVLGHRLIDPAMVHGMAEEIGLADPVRYWMGMLYWISINSILEEYVWRWFVVRQCARIMRPPVAVAAAALGFTVHHILAMQVYFNGTVTAVGTMCIAVGGALWSWMFLRYKTIWPGWLSHALVDIVIFVLGYVLIFG